MGDGRVPRAERLRRSGEFQAVFRNGQRIERRGVLLLWCARGATRKVGFAVSRQIRGAVCRNRLRRRLREAYRQTRETLPPGIQLVLVAREASADSPFEAVVRELKDAMGVIARRCGTSS